MHTPQPLMHLLRRRTNTDPLLTRQAQLTSKSAMRLPARALHRADFFQHLVDLLQAKTFHLRDEEESEDDGQDTERAPQEEDFGAEVGVSLAGADEVGGDDGLEMVSEGLLLGEMLRLTMMQFQNQLLAVESPTPRARIGRGKISPTTGMKVSLCAIDHIAWVKNLPIQADGPQVIANAEIFRQMNAIIALTACGFCPSVTPMIATIY